MSTASRLSFLLALACTLTTRAQQPAASLAIDPDIDREVRGVLDRAYASMHQPDLQPWVLDLASQDPAVRAHAGDALHAILVLVSEDSKNGRTPGREGMLLYSGPQDFGGELRWRLAESLGEAKWPGDGKAAEAAALWLFRNSPRVDERTHAVEALIRIRSDGADAVVREVVQKAHPTFRVLELALQAAAERSMRDLAPAAAALRDHYHPAVRSAAIAAAKALGRDDPAPDTTPDRMTPMIAGWLVLAADLVAEAIPADAKWSKVTLPADRESGRPEPMTIEGFLLDAGNGRPRRVLQAWGSVWPLDGAKPEITAASLADHAHSLIAMRTRYDAADMEEQRRIEGEVGIRRFMGSSGQKWHGSAAEILVAAWLHQRGDDALACGLVLPLLCAADDERAFFGGLLGDVAAELDEAMLAAFTMERDYPRALAMATKLARPECDFWWHQDRAIALAEQLPRRLGEFHELVLPAIADWPAKKAAMPRREQVVFLVDRLRLLNCMQMSNPGGIDYGADQYAEPLSKLDWRSPEKGLKVVNPFLELLQMDLLPEELELLIPLLTSPDYVLAFDLERFLPQRPQSLHRLQWVAGTLFEAAAREDLVDPRRLQGSVEERDKQIGELRAWCKRMAGVKTSARLATRLDAEKDPAKWRSVFWSLNETDPVVAADAAVRLAQRQPDRASDVAKLLVLLDRREHSGEARAWLDAPEQKNRFWASLLVLASGGDKDGACLEGVLSTLANADSMTVNAATAALLACGKPEAREFLVRCLIGKGPTSFRPTFAFAQKLLRAGYSEAITALDEAMAKPAESKLYDRVDGEIANDAWILYSIGEWHDLHVEPFEPKAEDLAKARTELRAWLRSEWEAVKTGKPTTMHDAGLELPWGDWVEHRSGWVRRL